MDFTHFMGNTGIEKHALGRGGLSCIDVGDNAYIAIATDGRFAGHNVSPLFKIFQQKKAAFKKPPFAQALHLYRVVED